MSENDNIPANIVPHVEGTVMRDGRALAVWVPDPAPTLGEHPRLECLFDIDEFREHVAVPRSILMDIENMERYLGPALATLRRGVEKLMLQANADIAQQMKEYGKLGALNDFMLRTEARRDTVIRNIEKLAAGVLVLVRGAYRQRALDCMAYFVTICDPMLVRNAVCDQAADVISEQLGKFPESENRELVIRYLTKSRWTMSRSGGGAEEDYGLCLGSWDEAYYAVDAILVCYAEAHKDERLYPQLACRDSGMIAEYVLPRLLAEFDLWAETPTLWWLRHSDKKRVEPVSLLVLQAKVRAIVDLCQLYDPRDPEARPTWNTWLEKETLHEMARRRVLPWKPQTPHKTAKHSAMYGDASISYRTAEVVDAEFEEVGGQRSLYSLVTKFAEEKVERHPSGHLRGPEAARAFTAWCLHHGQPPLADNMMIQFSTLLRAWGGKHIRAYRPRFEGRQTWGLIGLQLRDQWLLPTT